MARMCQFVTLCNTHNASSSTKNRQVLHVTRPYTTFLKKKKNKYIRVRVRARVRAYYIYAKFKAG